MAQIVAPSSHAKDLRITSYNSRGLPKSNRNIFLRPDIVNVFNESHIVAFQETWYSKQDLRYINTLHNEFLGSGAAKIDESSGLTQGRYSGGVAIMWRKDLDKYIKILDVNVDWCMAIELDMNSTKSALPGP